MEELNELRLKIRNRYITGIVILVIIAIALLVVFRGFQLIAAFNIIFMGIVAGVFIMMFATSKLKGEYRRKFKNEFVLKSLQQQFADLQYLPEKGIPYRTIADTKMMFMGDRYHSEDYISARYKNIRFEQADVHIEDESTDSDGNTTYMTIFKGRWMIFDFNKEFKANVQISQKGFGNSRVITLFGKKEDRLKKVSMESETFNKKFNVFAQNEHDAFYIITPSLMERIESLASRNNGKLLFCFIDNRLHIGIYDNKDSFEPGSVFKEINVEEMLQKISGDIGIITQFVDELNLDNDLFKKGV